MGVVFGRRTMSSGTVWCVSHPRHFTSSSCSRRSGHRRGLVRAGQGLGNRACSIPSLTGQAISILTGVPGSLGQDPDRSRRDGTIRLGLQSDTGHEHRRDQAAHRCDRGLRRPVPDLITRVLLRRFYTAKTQCRHGEEQRKRKTGLFFDFVESRCRRFYSCQ